MGGIMYTRLNTIRAAVLGFALAWVLMFAAALWQSLWMLEPFLWDPSRLELGLIYVGIGFLALVLSVLVGRPYVIYMGLHVFAWLLLGTGLLLFNTFTGPILVVMALVFIVILFVRMNPIMRWLASLDKTIYINGQPKQPRAASDDLNSYQHGYQPAAPQASYREDGQDFAYPQQLPPMEQAQ
jgi:hypothetical protein